MNLKDLLIRVLQGKASSREREQLGKWLNSIETDKRHTTTRDEESSDTRPDLAEIRRIVFENIKRQRRRRWIFITGILFIIFAITAVLLTQFHRRPTTFMFHNATIDEIARQIESNYSVRIIVDHKVADCRFTGEFHRVESAREILTIMTSAKGWEYLETGIDVFEITGVACN